MKKSAMMMRIMRFSDEPSSVTNGCGGEAKSIDPSLGRGLVCRVLAQDDLFFALLFIIGEAVEAPHGGSVFGDDVLGIGLDDVFVQRLGELEIPEHQLGLLEADEVFGKGAMDVGARDLEG